MAAKNRTRSARRARQRDDRPERMSLSPDEHAAVFGAYLRGLAKGGNPQLPFAINAGLQAMADAVALRAFVKARERAAARAGAAGRVAKPRVRCANPECGRDFTPKRRNMKYHDKSCRQSAWRARGRI